MKYRADVQGIRALAVLLVLFHHFFPNQLPGGFIGVDIFFVVSGFIITSIMLNSSENSWPKFLVDFYARRIRRILPSALLVMAVSTVMTYYLLGPITASDTALDGIFALLFMANIHFNLQAIDYFASSLPQPILQHYWSLSIEEQFYLCWPLLFFLAKNSTARKYLIVIVTFVSLSFAIIQNTENSPTAYLSTFTRVWELGLGAMLAIFHIQIESRMLSYFAIYALIGLSFALTSSADFPGIFTIIVTLFTIGMLITSHSNKLLSSQIMRWIGDRSYTLYLVHWPLIQIASLYKGVSMNLIEKAILLVLLFLLSALIFRFFENPLRHLSFLKVNAMTTMALGIGITLMSIAALMVARTSL